MKKKTKKKQIFLKLIVSARKHAVFGVWAFISSEDFSLVRVQNVHVIAGAWKLYLRSQNSKVFPDELYDEIIGKKGFDLIEKKKKERKRETIYERMKLVCDYYSFFFF